MVTIPNRHVLTMIAVLLLYAVTGRSMAPQPVRLVPVEYIRVDQNIETGALTLDLVIPLAGLIDDLARVEVRFVTMAATNAVFGCVLNMSDYCDPIPPQAFGVLLDPDSLDRSIENVKSAGLDGQWDQKAPGGVLLDRSAHGYTGQNLGIAFCVTPDNWPDGRYAVMARVTRRKSSSPAWQKLADFAYTAGRVDDVVQSRCHVRPVFVGAWGGEGEMPYEQVLSVKLISYERQPQDEGVVMKRWAGDTSDQYKLVEKEERTLKLSDFPGGLIPLAPGLYQFKHNSVYGRPPSGYYGDSHFFEIKPGQETMEVQIQLNAAI